MRCSDRKVLIETLNTQKTMKTKPQAATFAAAIAFTAIASTPCFAQGNSGKKTTIPTMPVGALSAYPTVVQTGTKPTLTWNIVYPSKVSDVATITPPGTITITKNNTTVSVQPIGTGLSAGNSAQGSAALPVEARISVNGSAYTQIFYGTQAQVNPDWVLYSKKLSNNTTIDFGGRYVDANQWTPFYTTRSSNMQVVALVDGDTPPTAFSLSESPVLANHLRPYLDASGKVNIGPLSVLVLMELNQNNKSSSTFDYQDMGLLLTFNGKSNNGHGNNLDGVDSSNPGRGRGGPTGLNNAGLDPSGGVDDEGR